MHFGRIGVVGSFTWEKIFSQTPFKEKFFARLGPKFLVSAAIAAPIAGWEVYKTYKECTSAINESARDSEFKNSLNKTEAAANAFLPEPTPADTATELAHTQQMLNNVSDELQTVTKHAANIKAPAQSHAEQAVMDKAAAEVVAPAMH